MNKNEKHKKIVKQRVIALVVTLLILTGAGFGIGFGLSELFEKMQGSTATAQPVEASSVPVASEATDDWIDTGADSTEEYTEVSADAVSEDSASDNALDTDPEIESVIAGMSLEQKVAQMFVITPEALTGKTTVTAAGDATEAALKKKPVAGIIYFAQNIVDPDQTTEMLTNMQTYAAETEGIPVFLCVDEEGGKVARVAGNAKFDVQKFDDMGTLSSDDLSEAYNVGSTIGKYLKQYGFNVDFAPVADVLLNKDNTVIGSRSFGSDPKVCADMSWQVASGLEDSGVTACFKHFPGHGGTEGDSHTGAVSSNETLEEMKADTLVPFQNAVTSGANMIMVGHISCPDVTGDNTPASLSSVMVTDVLRNDLGYQGIVITDALSMGAITGSYSSSEAAVMAVNAGDDLLLMPDDYDEAYNAILDAVNSGEIDEERINDSLRRILRVKLGKTGN